jgi:hypothetical protein
VTTDSPELNMADDGDRVWVCVPRNMKAQRMLGRIRQQGSAVRFRFESRCPDARSRAETFLLWHSGGRELRIRSPLSKYLQLSARPSQSAEWRPAVGHTYCRDYAVLARYKVLKDSSDPLSEYYYHYFVGGIRGLGTWGIGYLIDHESSQLARMCEARLVGAATADVALLVEVTYENFRITRVRDVSEQPHSFFVERYSSGYIKAQLRRHPEWMPTRQSHR